MEEQSKKFYFVQQMDERAELYIFGDIVEEKWLEGETSPTSIMQEIKGIDKPLIDVYIDSYGGSVSAGWAIYNELKNHPAKIRTYGTGFVASAALYPFLAGDERYASTVSAYFLHEVQTGAWGNAGALRAAAEDADKFTEIGINAFTERTGMSKENVLQLMQAETWLTPEEALIYGIATAIVQDKGSGISQSVKREVLKTLLISQREGKKIKEPEEAGKSIMQLITGYFNA